MSRPIPGTHPHGTPSIPGAGQNASAARAATRAAGAAAVADAVAFALLSLAGVALEPAQAAAYVVAIASGSAILWRTRDTALPAGFRTGVALVVVLLAYALRAGVLSLAAATWQWPAPAAIVPAALVGALSLGLGMAALVVVPRDADPRQAWRAAAALAVAYLLALRVVYMGQLELFPQEAYYWNYSQHLDIGYLDHPPLSAWLIALATWVRDGEFFVRLPAVLSWGVMVVFAALYARDAAGPDAAWRTVLLASTLPFFFLTGWVMVPDAPLAAAWAAALYYLQRALVAGEPRAFVGAGIAIGAGMLSKYSMILVPAAAFAYVLLDARSRRVLVSPWAWGGAVLALAVFSPVILWNVQHEWASFAFQGSRRLARAAAKFDFHRLVAFVLVVVTPWAVAGLAVVLARTWRETRPPVASTVAGRVAPGVERRRWWFVVVFTFVPLAGFAVPSLWSETKLHWTGPIWLAALPAIASSFGPASGDAGPVARLLARTWVPLLHSLMLGYALALFYYPVWGLAGIRALPSFAQTPWRELRSQVQAIEEDVLRETGRRPAVVGLDKHNTADEMTYYDPRGDGALDTASRHLFFDEDALMYERWFPHRAFDGRDLIVVSRSRGDVEDPRIAERAERLGPVRTIELSRHGYPAGRHYARVAYGYRAPARAAPAATPGSAATAR